ncbi:MAG: hypothetical protein ISR54_08220 [Chlorobium phaeobacteroides]|uniref:Uncharacterized protein n=1 Tax=Chlorobium phaeobacteroides (strain BS1) TaxID=331678 RepID=B3EN47_CHLPB|nr:hypothetical protein [Chlorobium phaeobacteroides]MBL6956779.1 hypothetical protein [Chlorobium phaeobacteroides]
MADPAFMQSVSIRVDSRVGHGNDRERERRGVMPPCVLVLHRVIRRPSTKKVKGEKSKVKKKIKKSSACIDGASLASK